MSMKKKLFFAAIALTTLAGCTDESYVGDQSLLTNDGGAISFNMKTPAITRSDASTAGKLGNEFVVFGYKTTTTPTDQVVFDNYVVKWVDNTASTTESNSANWEYVSYTSKATTPVEQSIKYWDFNASSYDFFAYSLGVGVDDDSDGGTPNVYATANVMTNSTYTLTGDQAKLGTCYISKKKHMESLSHTTTQVDLQFMNFLSKIQLKFYETIPGYSVKDVKFYTADGTKSEGAAAGDGLAPALYTASTIPTAGTYTITFDASYDPIVTLTSASSTATSVSFPAAVTSPSTSWLSDYAGKDYQEADETIYLGRTSNAATASKQISVLPNSTGATMTLKVDYTLLSRDGTGETIQVTGATATIPADYTKWKPNYAYTYIFKISDNTDGHIGGEVGLYPVTFDASVITDVAGNQTTITTVEPISITTYQSGAIANEYAAGNIYVAVSDGTIALTAGTNANLYTATVEAGAAQGLDGSGNVAITEEQVANVLTKTLTDGKYTVTDANGKKMTVTPVSSEAADKLVGGQTSIPAADAPGEKELAIKCAKFAAANNTVYVFEYIQTREQATGTYQSGTTYYTAIDGGTTVDTSGFEVGTTDVSSYFVTLGTPKKHYKVIKVGTPTAL